MNDGDLNENIDDHTQAIDGHHDGSGTVQNEAGGDQIHLDPRLVCVERCRAIVEANTIG